MGHAKKWLLRETGVAKKIKEKGEVSSKILRQKWANGWCNLFCRGWGSSPTQFFFGCVVWLKPGTICK